MHNEQTCHTLIFTTSKKMPMFFCSLVWVSSSGYFSSRYIITLVQKSDTTKTKAETFSIVPAAASRYGDVAITSVKYNTAMMNLKHTPS